MTRISYGLKLLPHAPGVTGVMGEAWNLSSMSMNCCTNSMIEVGSSCSKWSIIIGVERSVSMCSITSHWPWKRNYIV